MNSLCRNIIKAKDVKILGKTKINNFVDESPLIDDSSMEANNLEVQAQLEEEILRREEEIKLKLEEAQEKYQQIISDAKLEAERLIEESKAEVSNIEKKAYEQGHSQGLKNGYEDGYKEVYEEHIEKAKNEANQIIENANNILLEANNQVISYMKDNKTNILNLMVSIAEQVLREKFEDVNSMDNLITSVIEEYELKENFVIKVNPIYKESLDNQILNLKENHKIKGDVFVLGDESIEQGNAVIDNVKGSLILGIDGVLDKIKEELL